MAASTSPEQPKGLRQQVSRQQLAVSSGLAVVLVLVCLLVVGAALTG